MARLGFDAVGLGELGIRHWHLTDSLQQACPLPIIGTNIEIRRDGNWGPVGVPYRIIEKRGVRIGFLSVTNESPFSTHSYAELGSENFRILDPLATTRRVAAELKKKTDLVILLAHLDESTMEAYADSLRDVDVMVGGYRVAGDEEPTRIGSTIINRSGERGIRMAVTNLTISPESEILSFSGPNVLLTETLPEDSLVTVAAEKAKATMVERRRARMGAIREARQDSKKEMEDVRKKRPEKGLDG